MAESIVCGQNCVHSGEPVESNKSYHKCTKEGIKLSSLEKRSGCKYCPHFERQTKKKKTE